MKEICCLATLGGAAGGILIMSILCPISLLMVAASFTGALICSIVTYTWVTRKERRPIIYTTSTPPKLLLLGNSNINYQKVGYVRAMRWKLPLTPQQESFLNEKFGEGSYIR